MRFWGLEVGDWATWAGALGTFLAFGAVLFQLRRDKIIRTEDEEQERIIHQRKQAEMVSIWNIDNKTIISNQSNLPIYEVIAAQVTRSGQGPYSIELTAHINSQYSAQGSVHIAVIPPGLWETHKELFVLSGMGSKFGYEIAFRDSSGKAWIRKKDGALYEIENGYVTNYLGYAGPYAYDSIQIHVL